MGRALEQGDCAVELIACQSNHGHMRHGRRRRQENKKGMKEKSKETVAPELQGRNLWFQKRWWLATMFPALAMIIFFFIIPLVLLLFLGFTEYQRGQIIYRFSLTNYWRFFFDKFYLLILGRTFLIATIATFLCMVLGYPIAYSLARYESRFKGLLILLVMAPLLIGAVVRGYGWLLLLDKGGLVNSVLMQLSVLEHPIEFLHTMKGLIITIVEVLLPFFILPLIGVIKNVDPQLELAARSMGAKAFRTFIHVTLPLTLGGIIAGGSIVFSLAASIFVIPKLIGGPSYLLLSTLAFQQIQIVGNWPFGCTAATLMLVLTGIILLISTKILTPLIRV